MRHLIAGLGLVIIATTCALGRAEETLGDVPCEKEGSAATATDTASAPQQIVPQAAIDAATEGRYEDALPAYREALQRDPGNAERHANLAWILVGAEHTDEAIRELREAKRLEPERAGFSRDLAAVLAHKGRIEEAFQEFQHAIDLAPDDARSHFEFGKLYMVCRSYAGATEQFTAALQIEDTPKVRLVRSIALYRDGRYAEAIDDCGAVLSKDPGNCRARAYRAYANMRRGERDAARSDAERVLAAHTEVDVLVHLAHLVLGVDSFVRNDRDSTIEHLTRAIETDPTRPEAYVIRALDRMIAGESDGALADLDAAIGKADSPQELNFLLDGYGWQVYKLRGYVYLRFLKNWDAAIDDLTTAISLNNRDADCYVFRGGALYGKAEWARCVADFDQALTIAPENRLALLGLVQVLTLCPDRYIRDGRRAVQLATKACNLTEWEATEDLEMLAAAYSEVGEFENAIKWQSEVVEQARKPVSTDPKEVPRLPHAIAIAFWWDLAYYMAPLITESKAAARLELYRQGIPYRTFARPAVASKTSDMEPSRR